MPTSLGCSANRLAEMLMELSRMMRLQAAMLDAEGDHADAADLRKQASAYELAALAA